MADASMQCYYLDGARNQQGPVAGADIARLIRSGAINRDTLIWHPGMTDWRPAGQVNEFASLFAAPQPAPMRPPMAPGGGAAVRPPGAGGGFGAYEPQAAGGGYAGGGYAGGPGKSMGFGGAISSCLHKYANFNGRAARAEYWFWVLFQFLLIFGIVIVGSIIGTVLPTLGNLIISLGYLVVVFGLFLPALAVAVRRVHDTDRSGWFVLVPIFNIVLMFLPGTAGPNRFGEGP